MALHDDLRPRSSEDLTHKRSNKRFKVKGETILAIVVGVGAVLFAIAVTS